VNKNSHTITNNYKQNDRLKKAAIKK